MADRARRLADAAHAGRRAGARGPWDAAFFPNGEEGAHKVTNRTDETARIAILSNKAQPGVAVYPDSKKLGVWPPGNLFRLADAVDYWDGEL